MALTKIFESIRVGTMVAPNRLLMPPITTNLADHGQPGERMRNYYEARARGGMGMIMVEDAVVDSVLGVHARTELHLDDDNYIPGFKLLADTIKKHGTKAILVISHGGARAGKVQNGCLEYTDGKTPVSASPMLWAPGYVVPRAMLIEEIEQLIEKYALACARAREAGFDAVALHCSHGWLINQFISPAFNHRQDEYGRDMDGRLRFIVRILEETQKKVGKDYPIMARLSAEEPFEGGYDINQMKIIMQKLEKVGIAGILPTRGSTVTPPASSKHMPSNANGRFPRGCAVYLTEELRKAVKIPVVAWNRINDPVLAEQILAEGKADIIAMGRAVVADPELPNKARRGEFNDIRTCIACQKCLETVMKDDQAIVCTVNAEVGKENTDLSRVAKPKKVLVIGGGPGGMEAARVAAIRGHNVELWEKEEKLGGQLTAASKPFGKEEIEHYRKYLEGAVEKAGVKVSTGKQAVAKDIQDAKPDVVIMATGAVQSYPTMPGIDKPHIVSAVELLQDKKTANNRVVVLGGGSLGAEIAEWLVDRKKDVTIVSRQLQIAPELYEPYRSLLVMALVEKGVKVITNAKTEEITDTTVVAIKKGQRIEIPAETVVIALGFKPVEVSLPERFAVNVIKVGDCKNPENILKAIEDGFQTGVSI